ncbi:MAG: radical SAM/SPASM domain-containing protein [Nitrososphaeria archaeon]
MEKWDISSIFRLTSKVIFNMPHVYVQIEPTTKCNLKCRFCIRDDDVNSDMALALFKSIIDQLRRYKPITKTIDLTGVGEPLLCENLIKMIKYAKGYGFSTRFTSNFSAIDEAKMLDLIKGGLDCLYVSIDGASKHTFEKLRAGACFEKVLENIRLFIKTRKRLKQNKPILLLRPTISSENAHELPLFFKLAENLGVDGLVFGDLISRDNNHNCEDASAELLTKKLRKKRKVNIFNITKNFPPCINSCFISFDGKILPCGYLTQIICRKNYSRFQLGDLNQNSVSEIWFGQKYKQFKTQIIACNPQPKCATIAKCFL